MIRLFDVGVPIWPRYYVPLLPEPPPVCPEHEPGAGALLLLLLLRPPLLEHQQLLQFSPGNFRGGHTAKTKGRKFETNIPEKEYRGLSPNFHIHVSMSELYIPTMGLPFLLEELHYVDRSWEYSI